MTSKNDGIDWSAPVKVRAGKGAGLIVELPARVVGQLKVWVRPRSIVSVERNRAE